MSERITGKPQLIASNTVFGNPSANELETRISAACKYFTGFFVIPAKTIFELSLESSFKTAKETPQYHLPQKQATNPKV